MLKINKELEDITNTSIVRVANHLISNATTNEEVANNLEKEDKSLTEMWQYITARAMELQQNNSYCGDEDTIYGWAFEYYADDSIEVVGGSILKKVVDIELPNETEDVFEI